MKNEDSKSKILESVKEGVSLKKYTTFQIGGKAKYFFKAKTENELAEAVKWAKWNNLPFFILGGGSNLLISDKGYKGLVIKNEISEIEVQESDSISKDERMILTGSGTSLSKIVDFCQKNSLSGLEWASGIPGTVGGAVRGNAAAFGGSMGGVVSSVRVFDAKDMKFKTFSKKKCRFSPKTSVFKENSKLIITQVTLKLQKASLRKIKRQILKYLQYRKEHHPRQPSPGCVFVNPVLAISEFNSLLKKLPEAAMFKKLGYVPTSFLIDRAGLKGLSVGEAKVSQKHANFIINPRRKAKSKDVLKLIFLIKKEIKKKFGIVLKEEIYYLE